MSDNNSLSTNKAASLSDKMTKLINEKKAAREFQKRKHADWDENYELYRNKVKINRLTQRQAVNIPLMKETIKTLLSKVDDPISVVWKEKSGDQMKEIIYQEIWDSNSKEENLEGKDIMDKKNVFLYGLSTKKLNLKKKGISISVMDIYDVYYDPLTSPLDIETARYIVVQNIFRPLREILADERYTKEGREDLKHFIESPKGIVQSGKTKEEWERSLERLRAMGVKDERFASFSGGDVLVNLTEHYTELWDVAAQKFKRHVVVYADETVELMDELLVDLIGIEEWPLVFWSEDPETNDVYPDGIADLVRTPNKVLNIWFSQQVENRTLQNFQMHWYDATQQGYTPQTYEPGPGRMLPAPGDPNKTIMPVQVNGLDETFKAIDFLTNVVERGTGATAIEKGQAEAGVQTLGEVQILVGKAGDRAKTMTKFYHRASYELSKKWDKMMQANAEMFEEMTLYKTGQDGKVYKKVVYPKDWKSEAGYEPSVESSSDQEASDIKSIQKFSAVMAQFPNNSALRRALQTRQLKILDLSASELKEIDEEELKLAEQARMQAQASIQQGVDVAGPVGTAPQPAAAPVAPQSNPEEDALMQQLQGMVK